MNKGELIDVVANTTQGISKKQIAEVLDAFIAAVMVTVANGKKVTLVGFGSFEKRHRAERQGRNPKTQEAMIIPAADVPTFHAGKDFKGMVSRDRE